MECVHFLLQAIPLKTIVWFPQRALGLSYILKKECFRSQVCGTKHFSWKHWGLWSQWESWLYCLLTSTQPIWRVWSISALTLSWAPTCNDPWARWGVPLERSSQDQAEWSTKLLYAGELWEVVLLGNTNTAQLQRILRDPCTWAAWKVGDSMHFSSHKPVQRTSTIPNFSVCRKGRERDKTWQMWVLLFSCD